MLDTDVYKRQTILSVKYNSFLARVVASLRTSTLKAIKRQAWNDDEFNEQVEKLSLIHI